MTTLVLVHGFNETVKHMLPLKNDLMRRGYHTLALSLPTRYSSLDACVAVVHQTLSVELSSTEDVCFIAHSFGGLVIRRLLNHYPRSAKTDCIFIATPCYGSKLAEIADKIPGFSSIFSPLDALKPCELSDRLEKPIRIANIAGTLNNLWLGKFFLSELSDGRVELSSVQTPDQDELHRLPLGHKEIHRHPQTFELIVSILGRWGYHPAS